MHAEKRDMFYFIGGLVVGAIIGFFADMFLLRQRYSAEADALREQLNRSRDRLHELQADVDRHVEASSSLQVSLTQARQRLEAQTAEIERLQAASAATASLQSDLTATQAEVARWQSQVEAQSGDAQRLQQALDTTQAELASLQTRLAEVEAARTALQAEVADCAQVRQQLAELETELAEVRTVLAHETADPGEPDDLARIEGIGPKIASVLNEAGIHTFARLARTPVERLQGILEAAGLARLATPATWPQQAELAAREDWEGLEALQASLKGGRRG